MSSSGSKIVKLIKTLKPYVRDLNEFFEEFDCYDGRIFKLWEIVNIADNNITEKDLQGLRDENDRTERLFNDEISYKFLFMCIVTAPDCP